MWSEFTVSGCVQPQVLHAVPDEFRKLLPLRASRRAHSLLDGAEGGVTPLHAPPTETPRPVHALLSQERVL